MRVISVLPIQVFGMAEWRRLPSLGSHTGAIGQPTSNLWEWTLSFRVPLYSHTTGTDDVGTCSVQLVVWMGLPRLFG
jgi:hypothetical protein